MHVYNSQISQKMVKSLKCRMTFCIRTYPVLFEFDIFSWDLFLKELSANKTNTYATVAI